jgi:hypothetical protein
MEIMRERIARGDWEGERDGAVEVSSYFSYCVNLMVEFFGNTLLGALVVLLLSFFCQIFILAAFSNKKLKVIFGIFAFDDFLFLPSCFKKITMDDAIIC